MINGKCVVGYVLRKFPVLSETFVLNEILALEARGVEVHIFPLEPSRDPRFHEGVGRLKATIHHVPGPLEFRTILRQALRMAGRNPRRFRRQFLKTLMSGRPKLLWRFLQAAYVADRARRIHATHLHAHFANHPATVAQQASKLLGIPFSFTAHAYDVYRDADLSAIARKMTDAKFTATISECNLGFLRSIANGRGARIELVRNGIDMNRFVPSPVVPEGKFRLLTVSRLVEKKGLPILVEACRYLRDRGLDFHCEIVGKGAQKSLLEQLIREWHLREHVRLAGPLAHQEVLAYYQHTHLMVLPCITAKDGNRDGLPVSIVEALACGVPVISTPATGIPEAVHDGVNGILVPQGDAAALADAIEKLIRNPDLLSRLRAEARPSVLDLFDERRTVARLHELFMEATA